MRNKLLQKLYKDLEKYSDFSRDEKNQEYFINTIYDIAQQKDPSCIKVLLQYMSDEKSPFVFQTILHAIENFSDEIYVNEVSKNIGSLIKNKLYAPYVIARILNNSSTNTLFKRTISKMHKKYLSTLSNLIKEELPEHQDVLACLRFRSKEGY